MISFATANQSSELAFQEMMKCKMEAEKEKAAIEKRRFLMFLIKKKPAEQSAMKSLNSSRIPSSDSCYFHLWTV
jgi:hypothetical protein